ncbi:hypothetical protein HZI73_09475 [Vallitalea pronyensis]|uniref:Uncharacterized protein n=1 Tax=Vallitalea pronyensis TaxID=1348613 RepID=A0A8J8MJC7_9FIRM|nr:DUF6179 domain-containing protein [Vallitalea pronyensis]QUI22516.1 hypothetical protein HZI73_09475 [Vallitalea pronyensis]
MKTNHIMKSLKLENEKIGTSQYTLSLMAQGIHEGLLQPQRVRDYQQDVLEILKKLLVKYTFGESSSVKVEVAENIMCSIYYVMDLYFTEIEEPGKHVAQLKDMGVQKVYEEGLAYVHKMVETCKAHYESVKENRLALDMIAYQDTITDGLGQFFKLYNVLFGAHDTMCNIDYPLAIDDMGIEGILYIKQYVEHLDIENTVCGYFSLDHVERLLENYGDMYKIAYKEALINVFELIVNQYIFCLMLDNTNRELQITKMQYAVIEKELSLLQDHQVNRLVDDLFDRFVLELEISESRVIQYINRYKEKFIHQLLQNRKINLAYFIIVEQEKSKKQVVLMDNKEKMDDETFKKLVESIIDCATWEDKIKLIKENMTSLVDFVDVLKADCLFDDEYTKLYETIEDMELAILGKIIYHDALRLEQVDIMNLEHLQLEEPWQWYLDDYIKQLDRERLCIVTDFMNEYDMQM